MSLYFSQLILFRPFLHYLQFMAKGKALPLAQSRHALACVKIASTTILRAEILIHQLPEVGATWSATYTLFLAVLVLIFLISAHDGTSQPGEAWRRAVTGLRSLYSDRCIEDCAFTGIEVLKLIVRQLNHTVDFDFDSIERHAAEARRASVSKTDVTLSNNPATYPLPSGEAEKPDPAAASGEPIDHYADADRMLAHAEILPLGFGFVDLLNAELEEDIENIA